MFVTINWNLTYFCTSPVLTFTVSVHQLLKYDKEVRAFHDVITEEDIKFPPR